MYIIGGKEEQVMVIMTKKKRICSLLLVFLMCLVCLFSPMTASAQTEGESEAGEKTVLTIRVGDKVYKNVTGGTVIIGDFNLEDLEFWVESVNGNALENVGSKSNAKDSQGRNPLEIATIPHEEGSVTVTLIYHAEDDPVIANQSYGFSVVGITFANSKKDVIKAPTVKKITGVKATALKKSLKISWKKSSITGYEIQYCTNKKFKSAKTIKVGKTKTAYTIKKLGAKKTYYVRIRGYKTYNDDLGNAQVVYGKWTTIKKKTK